VLTGETGRQAIDEESSQHSDPIAVQQSKNAVDVGEKDDSICVTVYARAPAYHAGDGKIQQQKTNYQDCTK
jgi:hypothetical protein